MNLSGREFQILQKKELGELFGFESRNKYEILDEHNLRIGFAAEQGKGFGALFMRQLLGHWRTFEIHIFNENRQLMAKAVHPFRFFFQCLEIYDPTGRKVAVIQQRFAILQKKFDISIPGFSQPLVMKSPFWKFWTFPVYYKEKQIATISKKWSGFFKEAFTDADNFRLKTHHPKINGAQKIILIAASLFIDLLYFEKKAGND